MPQEVIDRVNQLGKAEGQTELLTFYDRTGRLIGDMVDTTQVEDDRTEGGMIPMPDAGVDARPNNVHGFRYDIFDGELAEGIEGDPNPAQPYELEVDPIRVDGGPAGFDNNMDEDIQIEPEEPEQEPPLVFENDDAEQQPEPQLIPLEPPQDTTQIQPESATWVRRSTRTQQKPEQYTPYMYGKSYVNTHSRVTHPDAHIAPDFTLVSHYIMTQLSMNAGLKRWKDPAEKALTKELH